MTWAETIPECEFCFIPKAVIITSCTALFVFVAAYGQLVPDPLFILLVKDKLVD